MHTMTQDNQPAAGASSQMLKTISEILILNDEIADTEKKNGFAQRYNDLKEALHPENEGYADFGPLSEEELQSQADMLLLDINIILALQNIKASIQSLDPTGGSEALKTMIQSLCQTYEDTQKTSEAYMALLCMALDMQASLVETMQLKRLTNQLAEHCAVLGECKSSASERCRTALEESQQCLSRFIEGPDESSRNAIERMTNTISDILIDA